MAKKTKLIVEVDEPSDKKERPGQFKPGNEWWRVRSKIGADKIFKNPKTMWSEAVRYFEYCDANPEQRAELVKYEGGAKEVNVSVKRLYTLMGVCRFLHINTGYFAEFKRQIAARSNKPDKDDNAFSVVIKSIEETIQDQQISGAASGFFNGNIISRLVGLVDKKDITTAGGALSIPAPNVYTNAPPLATSEEDIKG